MVNKLVFRWPKPLFFHGKFGGKNGRLKFKRRLLGCPAGT